MSRLRQGAADGILQGDRLEGQHKFPCIRGTIKVPSD